MADNDDKITTNNESDDSNMNDHINESSEVNDVDTTTDNQGKEAIRGEVVSLEEDHSRLVELRTVEDVMENSFLRYSMSVIIDRALPDVRDGLKPVHRRILYTMEKNGWRPGTKFVKSARIVGDVMGKYHPHGDSAIYDAMVRLAQNWTMRYCLVEGQGNFGSMDGDPPAANRYTEARMHKVGAELLVDLDKETVDFRDNYDGTLKEPTVLPAKLPQLLLNGQMGIAVGMATNIPTHNLSELCDAIVHLIDNGVDNTTTEDLLTYVKGPDFPTGGIVYGGAPMKQAYLTGRGSVVIRAVAEIEEGRKGRHQIVVTEIPYGVNKATLQERMADLVNEKKIGSIYDIRDESARGNVRLVIELKKDAYPKKILNQLFKMTSLQTSFHYNMLALVDGIQPRILGLKDILTEYLKHREIVVRRRTEYELKKARERAHILEGLKIALDNIDAVIALIRASKSYEEARDGLMKQFKLSEIQAQAILAMQLRKLTGLERQAIEDELKELHKLIKELESILADEQKILAIIREELLEMKEKYGDDRRTQIINHEIGKMSEEDVIPEENVVILLTTENYIKRTLVSDYRRQNRGGKGKRGVTTKEADIVDQLITCNTHDFLSFFTNKGRVFRLRAYEVPAASLQAKGVAAVNLLQLQPDEKITSIIKSEKDANDDGYLFMTTVNGTVKKTAVKDYANIRQTGLIAIKLDEGDELRWVKRSSGKEDIVISTSFGQAIRFNEQDARPMGRSARGVRGIRLRPGDSVVGMDLAEEGKNLLLLSENGYGKMTKVANFPSHRRGGIGIKAAVVSGKTGNLITVKALDTDASEIIAISAGGQTIRVALKDIPLLGRATQGVRIMRLADSDSVASVGLIPEQTKELSDDESTEVESS
ncbi:MAG TPA: DNA gyrase subunit A [Candidatus Nanoperiomorbaceae bacterium]|nr:DNA gyrase subunit A [Candidatus Nanoperiomorbaceae bacterium]HMR85885.1 DNA gyrase subunit A [Candidatus Nanoperiomorbaceae bacterium]HMU11734.1 DNA gyrase subunit A [Candidatus Nanoperiomorbaceae bacterium]